MQFCREETSGPAKIDQDLLRKYILYAREKIHPKLSADYENKMASLYSEMRKESLVRYFYSYIVSSASSRQSLSFYKITVSDRVSIAGYWLRSHHCQTRRVDDSSVGGPREAALEVRRYEREEERRCRVTRECNE